MASTLKVDNLQTQDGDSYNVVSWDTTAKTTAFTAVSGKGYFVDTSSAAITVTLPASPSAGDIVAVKDYAGTAAINAITIARNGSNIRGDTNDFTLEKNNAGATFIYVDGTEGWQVFVDGSDTDAQPNFICASGGTETTCGDFKIHTFTGPGTFTVNSLACAPANNTVGYQVVAGGGGGGFGYYGGGGGAGGFREGRNVPIDNFTASPLVADAPTNAVTVTATAFPITVGAGGAGSSGDNTKGGNGSNSVFSTITSAGGGTGGVRGDTPGTPTALKQGSDGGSGGGSTSASGAGGSGNSPPTTPSQGEDGGSGGFGGGGGGAGCAGGNGTPASPHGANGGDGVSSSITGSSVARSGGGGGGSNTQTRSGGTGGGGDGGVTSGVTPGAATAGTANTGGGGGGGGGNTGPTNALGAAGGSGIVIIRYKFQ